MKQRSRLARLGTEAAIQAATRADATGDHLAAVRWYHRGVELDPLDVTLAVRLADALVGAGDRPGALRTLRDFQARIRKELGVGGDPDIGRRVALLAAQLTGGE